MVLDFNIDAQLDAIILPLEGDCYTCQMSSLGLGGKYIFRENVESAMVKSTKFRADCVRINADVIIKESTPLYKLDSLCSKSTAWEWEEIASRTLVQIIFRFLLERKTVLDQSNSHNKRGLK
jgi:hypothetical protein